MNRFAALFPKGDTDDGFQVPKHVLKKNKRKKQHEERKTSDGSSSREGSYRRNARTSYGGGARHERGYDRSNRRGFRQGKQGSRRRSNKSSDEVHMMKEKLPPLLEGMLDDEAYADPNVMYEALQAKLSIKIHPYDLLYNCHRFPIHDNITNMLTFLISRSLETDGKEDEVPQLVADVLKDQGEDEDRSEADRRWSWPLIDNWFYGNTNPELCMSMLELFQSKITDESLSVPFYARLVFSTKRRNSANETPLDSMFASRARGRLNDSQLVNMIRMLKFAGNVKDPKDGRLLYEFGRDVVGVVNKINKPIEDPKIANLDERAEKYADDTVTYNNMLMKLQVMCKADPTLIQIAIDCMTKGIMNRQKSFIGMSMDDVIKVPELILNAGDVLDYVLNNSSEDLEFTEEEKALLIESCRAAIREGDSKVDKCAHGSSMVNPPVFSAALWGIGVRLNIFSLDEFGVTIMDWIKDALQPSVTIYDADRLVSRLAESEATYRYREATTDEDRVLALQDILQPVIQEYMGECTLKVMAAIATGLYRSKDDRFKWHETQVFPNDFVGMPLYTKLISLTKSSKSRTRMQMMILLEFLRKVDTRFLGTLIGLVPCSNPSTFQHALQTTVNTKCVRGDIGTTLIHFMYQATTDRDWKSMGLALAYLQSPLMDSVVLDEFINFYTDRVKKTKFNWEDFGDPNLKFLFMNYINLKRLADSDNPKVLEYMGIIQGHVKHFTTIIKSWSVLSRSLPTLLERFRIRLTRHPDFRDSDSE